MRITTEDRILAAFISTLASIVLLSKIGGTGADLAIMTALAAVLGGLAQGFRRQHPPKDEP